MPVRSPSHRPVIHLVNSEGLQSPVVSRENAQVVRYANHPWEWARSNSSVLGADTRQEGVTYAGFDKMVQTGSSP